MNKILSKIKNDILNSTIFLLFVLSITSCTTEKEESKIPLSSENSITAFKISTELNPSLIEFEDVTATIYGTNIYLSLISDISYNISKMKPSIIFSGKSISPAAEVAQDFTEPVTYIVTAEDGSTKTYSVRTYIISRGSFDVDVSGVYIDYSGYKPTYDESDLEDGYYNLAFYDHGSSYLKFRLNSSQDGKWTDVSTKAASGWSPHIEVYLPYKLDENKLYVSPDDGGTGKLKITRTPNTFEFHIQVDVTTKVGKKIKGSFKGVLSWGP
jgi:hypothetical protein